MKKILVCIVALSILLPVSAQVGIGTTDPDPSAILDMNAPDKGILIPRVALSNISDIQLDGLNNAAEGLLIYNTNPSVTGGMGTGYYLFSGSVWLKLITNKDDNSWYAAGTTNSASSINDDIYTHGKVGVGNNLPAYALDIQETSGTRGINTLVSGSLGGHIYGSFVSNANTSDGTHYGSYQEVTGTAEGEQFASYSLVNNTGDGQHVGSFNLLIGNGMGPQIGSAQYISNIGYGNHIGSYNFMSGSGTGIHYGSYSNLIGSGSGIQYGSYNNITNSGNSSHYGVLNNLGGSGNGNKYGSYNFILNTAGGTHYGVYSEALKTGSFAGYFKGVVSIEQGDLVVDGTTLVVDESTDNVGIGTTTPTEKLEVNGTIKAVDVNFSGLQTYVDNAEALAAGLTAGDLYKTAEGILRIVY